MRRRGWLTEFDLWPQIVDADLNAADAETLYLVTSGGALTNLQQQIVDAWDYLIWDLYNRGIQAHLLDDGSELVQPLLWRSLAESFGMAIDTDDDHYAGKVTKYLARYEDAMGRAFSIDADASGAADEQDMVPEDPSWPESPLRPRAW